VAYSAPPESDAVAAALGLPGMTRAEYSAAFVLLMPPHAAIHLGPEGKLGGEGLDRVDGFWRSLGVPAVRHSDHLGVLLMCYADLAAAGLTAPAGAPAAVLFHEHIWPWAPAYLTELADLGIASVTEWARLALEVCRGERCRLPEPAALPLALRAAPPPITPGSGLPDVLDAMVCPVRSGILLTHRNLSRAAVEIGVGYRRGERRFALKAMVEQDAGATLEWLGRAADRWAVRHATNDPTATGRWWATRAGATAAVLDELAANVH
jgi:hypothetical protein